MQEKAEVYNMDFEQCLEKNKNQKFDIIYIDPPYETDFIMKALEKIVKLDIIKSKGKIILETDNELRILKQIENIDVEIVDKRKYGRATIIFLNRKYD